MPKYRVKDSISGKTLDLTGDSPPTDQELSDIFSSYQKPTYKDPAEAFQKGGKPALDKIQKDRTNRITSGIGIGNKIAGTALKVSEEVGKNPMESLFSPKYTTGIKSPNEIPDIMALLNPTTLATKPFEFLPQTKEPTRQFSKETLYSMLPTPATIIGSVTPKVIEGASPLISKVSKFAGNKVSEGTNALKEGGKLIGSKMPQLMGEKWFEGQAKSAQKVAGGLEKMRGSAYENIYSKLNNVEVPQIEVSDILQKYDLIEELGVPPISDIESLKNFSDELGRYVPQQIKTGKVYGKGGFANPKIRAEQASREIKNLMYESIQDAESKGNIAKGSMAKLKGLDELSHEKLYPRAEKIREIGGYSPEPETSGVTGAYKILRGSEGSAGKRLAIKRTPKALEELKSYIAPEKQRDLANAIINSKQLAKDMSKYRTRQLLKAGATGGAGGLALWDYLFRRKVGSEVLNKAKL